jgi:fructokinase
MKALNTNLWGIDLGGTKVEGVVLDSAKKVEVLFRDRLLTESNKGYDHILDQIESLVKRMERAVGYRPTKIGIGTPGTVELELGTIKNSNTICLNDRLFRQDLEARLGIQLIMDNDANCFALAEANMGIVKERYPRAKVVFGVIMGTGVGGGLVVDGKIINGLHGIGGEWGHNFLDESGGPCYCGKSGCVEMVLCGPSLEKFYYSKSGVAKSLREIDHLSRSGSDEIAVLTMKRLAHFFGLAISVVTNIVDPDVIVIGGGVGNIDIIYSEGVESLKKYIFNNRVDTPILKPKLGDSAGVFGAAFLTI